MVKIYGSEASPCLNGHINQGTLGHFGPFSDKQKFHPKNETNLMSQSCEKMLP